MRRRVTLAGTFVWLTGGTLAAVGVLLYGFLATSRRSILEAADPLRRAAASRVEIEVTRELSVARTAAEGLARQVRTGTLDPDDTAMVERSLFARLVDDPALAEVAFTRASSQGYDEHGDAVLAPGESWELAVYRAADGQVVTRTVRPATGWRARLHARAPGGEFADVADSGDETAEDPTRRPTFVAAAARSQEGLPLWSDLHWSDVDSGGARRVVMTVQQAVSGPRGPFAGVARVGLLTDRIDAITRLRVDPGDASDPHRVFLCDARGRLLARLGPRDRLVLSGDDLRFVPSDPPPEVTAALRLPALGGVEAGRDATAAFDVGGERHLVTFRGLPGTQDWVVGITVPEAHYTARLRAARDRFLALYGIVAAAVLGAGVLASAAVRRGLRRVDEATARMRAFRFDRGPTDSPFRDVESVLESLERAKTAMRALGKYAPLDLVRELARANVEPTLGGRPEDVTVMFADIQGFTGLAEGATPSELAELLGAYLDAMTQAIRATGGTIDKFIGDAVMALWNAPGKVERHPRQACRAVVACMQATRALYASPRWGGRPPLVTRFGVHTDRVLVGHFGAPERMSYTALGDGVNLASRLEGLGKQYGVTAIVSEAVASAAGDEFAFRRLDKVAVKGKSAAVVVYELVGARAAAEHAPALAEYEAALDDYFARRFERAAARLSPLAGADGPSRVLLARCRALAAAPPADGWDGVFAATSK